MTIEDVILDIDRQLREATAQYHMIAERIKDLRAYRRVLFSEKELADFARETVKLQTGKDV